MQFEQTQPRAEPEHQVAGMGATWISVGWGQFKAAPGVWITLTLVWALIQIGGSMLPLGDLALAVLGPVFAGGFLFAARDQQAHKEIGIGHLFAAFRSPRLGPLALLGFLILLLFMGLAVVFVLLLWGALGSSINLDTLDTSGVNGAQLLLPSLVFLLALMPLLMAVWFAGSLVALQEVSPSTALSLSLRGCWRNLGSLTIFGLLMLPLSLLALIPLGLGLLVLYPVAMLAMYRAYLDIFREPLPESAEI